ncbi:venom carboxylesterase-6-like isoform X1 [Vespa velutina]|uniref:venom carboxylesterase-6-like isoform X1 n=1 Tax=Vespa velutina TaxID=202808 RepID=UPI001FB4EBFB|nr:venom carboxylesterase-6-like isoform X1 [Vespa velutina]
MLPEGLAVLLLFLTVILAIDFENIDKSPMIETKFGSIVGKWTKSSLGLNIATFLGIPYAEPPIGDLRFREPRAWNNTWDELEAKYDTMPCLQLIEFNTIIGSEDCLYLNVYVPANQRQEENTKHPVLVFIHGGAFNIGSNNSTIFSATYWADQQVILVVLNYRLGPLGFFSLANCASPGNYGLKDITMALKWVKENIESFGGDRNSVTLMGQSAGAAAVHILTLSKKTEGLFDKYILLSGSALATWAVHPKHIIRKISKNMADDLGCSKKFNTTLDDNVTEINDNLEEKYIYENYNNILINYDQEIIDCMRSLDANKILMNLSYLYSQHKYQYCFFGPTIEEESSDAILTMYPMEIIKKQLFRDIPCIIGVVQDEGLLKTFDFYGDSKKMMTFMNNFDALLPGFLEVQDVINNVDNFTRAIKDFYFGENGTNILLKDITKMAGDGLITWPTYKTVKYLSKVMKSNLFFYCFAYSGTFSSKLKNGTRVSYGVSHGDELNYFFPILNKEYESLISLNTESDNTMINIMTELWSHFMRTGIPSTWSTPNWPAYRYHHEYMLFNGLKDVYVTIEKNYYLTDRMKFWDNLMYNYNEEFNEWYLDDNEIKETNRGYRFSTIEYIYLLITLANIILSV